MKRTSYLVIPLLILSVGIFLTSKPTSALSMSAGLKGKILLQVESKGEAWYVSPVDGKRYNMGRPNDAFDLMKKLGVGITNDNLNKIQIANENLTGQDSDNDGLSDMVEDSIGTNKNNKDSDSDGFDDKNEVINGYNPKGAGKIILNSNLAKQQSGKILLQVENKGEAWYVNPNDNKRYFLGRPNDAFNLMRKLGLGITNNDLNKITKNNDQTQNKNTICDNYQCLISAASKCQPISVTISYSEIPDPFFTDFFHSGQTMYEIQKSSGANDCAITFSSLVDSMSISNKGRQVALAKGSTDAQINAQLQTMNASIKSVAGTQTVCQSNANAISDYLADTQKGNTKVEGNGQTTTYTTSSGQKLSCKIVPPAGQSANTSITIKDTECTAKKGVIRAVSEDGTACSKNQTDLGMVVGDLKLNDKYPQCCVDK